MDANFLDKLLSRRRLGLLNWLLAQEPVNGFHIVKGEKYSHTAVKTDKGFELQTRTNSNSDLCYYYHFNHKGGLRYCIIPDQKEEDETKTKLHLSFETIGTQRNQTWFDKIQRHISSSNKSL